MIHIAICDDDIRTVNKIKSLVEVQLFDTDLQYKIYTFVDGNDFINSNIDKYNIVFLDVELGNTNGIKIASEFRKINSKAILIFISQYIEYTPEGYTVNAFRYILKSTIDRLFENDFKDALKEVTKIKKYFTFKFDRETISIPTEEIIYFESRNNKIIIYLNNKDYSQYEFYGKLDEVEKNVEDYNFLRIQQSILVNIKYISKLSSYKILLSNGEELATTRKNYKELVEKYARMKWRYIDGICD